MIKLVRLIKVLLSGGWKRRFAVGLFALAFTSCASPDSYMGISLLPGVVDPELQDLAARAQADDKQAQLELGIALEEGRKIQRDLTGARHLYRLAATDETVIAYSPPTGNSSYGTVHRLVQAHTGLDAAKRRLHDIDKTIELIASTGKTPR